MYKISIIMPIFNAEKYFERSINSILNQTMDLEDIEVIMVDDNSTDNTRKMVQEYEKKYPNFKGVYHEKNSGGCAIPRNSGLAVSTGEYVMFLDPDDEYAPDMCETLYNKIKNNGYKIVKCNHKLIYENSKTDDYQFDKNIPEVEIDCKKDLPPNTSSVCNTIHDRDFIIKNNITFANLKNAEDMAFSLEEFFNTDKILVMNNYAGYYYYTNPEISHARKPTRTNLEETLKAYMLARDIIKQNGRNEILLPYFSKRCFGFFMLLLNYEGNKKEYFNKFYEFEKSLDCILNFEFAWANIVNKMLMKNRISTAIFVLNGFNLIRTTPMINIYRKFL